VRVPVVRVQGHARLRRRGAVDVPPEGLAPAVHNQFRRPGKAEALGVRWQN